MIQRDRHAELMAALAITAASLEKFALEIRGLQKTEIGEVEEPFGKGQKGSSAMPHKRNPDRLRADRRPGAADSRQRACGARERRAVARSATSRIRPVERVILPDSFIALDHMLRRFTRIVRGMVVYRRPDAREPESLARRRVFRDACCSSSRRKACRASRRTSGCSATRCARSTSSATSRRCCWPIADVSRVLTAAEIERAFDLDEQLKHVDHIFDRVFQPP